MSSLCKHTNNQEIQKERDKRKKKVRNKTFRERENQKDRKKK